MPHVINGIGTWYYGKRRIHTRKGACEFCGRQADLVSFDTTLFFVVLFVPVIPLSKKRIFQQCSLCTRHRAMSLAKWEQSKARDSADLLEKLRASPDDRDTLLRAIGFALAYQDEPLFDSIVETLSVGQSRDAAVQAQLGHAYAYFSRWPEAEQAYRAALGIQDNDDAREQLALTLLKQKRPEEARPYLQHVLEKKKAGAAGLVYMLVDGYQTQGLHEEALALMDERDRAFPDFAKAKEYQRQRKTSLRYRDTGKKVASAVLAGGKTGYREGGWTARVPALIATLVLLAIPATYFGSAAWIGHARKVFLVNGTFRPYTVVVGGAEHTVQPLEAKPVRVPEGDVRVAFRDAGPGLEPVQARVETPFWSRPFTGHTFVINPDRSAVVLEQEAFYAAANPPPSGPPTVHFGQPFYDLPGVDFEFQAFPQTIQVDGGSCVRKTRVGFGPQLTAELRLQRMAQDLGPGEQVEYCKLQLALDPKGSLFLEYLADKLPPDELIAFVEPRLGERPLLVDWHRVYQTLTERAHPEADLLPRYRKLLAESNGDPDAVYLLGRADPDLDESEKLFGQAASANPPSGHAIAALGWHAHCEGRFAEAIRLYDKALPLLPDKTAVRQRHYEALLANGDYDTLLRALQADGQVPGRKLVAAVYTLRVDAVRGEKAKARQALAEVVRQCPPQEQATLRKSLEPLVCCWENDPAGYLKAAGDPPPFAAALLRGNLKEAADRLQADGPEATADHGLLYLAATRSGAKDLAKAQWDAFLAGLSREDHDHRIYAAMLSGKRPPDARLARRLPVEPNLKRVVLAVLAQRQPDQAKGLLALAKKLNFQRDDTSLCLQKVLQP